MSEEGIIKKAIMDHYHEGHVQFKPELYDGILHDDWKFFCFNKEGKLELVDKETYKSWYNPEDRDDKLEWYTEILNIDITGNNASVKLKIGNQTVEYTDYFNMIKVEDKWWVVNKISSAKRFD
ncbi:MAG: nuclear transport factor 2 family protein [Candidatus Thorarchaeota archaeon]